MAEAMTAEAGDAGSRELLNGTEFPNADAKNDEARRPGGRPGRRSMGH